MKRIVSRWRQSTIPRNYAMVLSRKRELPHLKKKAKKKDFGRKDKTNLAYGLLHSRATMAPPLYSDLILPPLLSRTFTLAFFPLSCFLSHSFFSISAHSHSFLFYTHTFLLYLSSFRFLAHAVSHYLAHFESTLPYRTLYLLFSY